MYDKERLHVFEHEDGHRFPKSRDFTEGLVRHLQRELGVESS